MSKSKRLIRMEMQSKDENITVRNVNALANGTNIPLPGTNSPENEPSVAVNPMNPLTIIAVSHDYTKNGFALFRSFNGGNTFTGSILPVTTSFDVLSDPIIDFGLNNISLISGIAVKNATNEASIIVFRSVDGGQNYANSIIVSTETGNGIFDDKEYLAIDKSPTSPFVGNAYISYTRFTGNFTNSQILLQRSVNGGLNWLPPVPITPVLPGLPFVQGSNVQVGPNGGVYVAWTEGDFNNALFKIRRSDDGGITFGPTITVSNIVEVPSPLNAKVPQWGFRVPTFAFLAVDTSGCFGSAEFARVYAAWQDFRSGNAHILLSFSDDGGANWSAPIRVDNSPEGSQNFFPFVTASPCSGTVNVIYYTNRESTTLLDVFGAKSLDGGLSFTSNSRITDVSFNPNADPSFGEPCQFIGDYIFAAISPPNASEPEKLISVWTDTLSGSQDIFANIDDQTRTPIISCPANITQNNAPGQCGAVVVFPPPSVNNICPGATVACTPASGSFFPVGTTTVTCMATDPCGGSAQCSFTVTVKDIEPPTIACPANITQVNDPSKCGAIVHYPAPVISDNCPGVTAVCSPASGSFFPVGTTTVTCTATDTAGNTAICSFTVTVKDIEPPTITCSANITQANDPGESGAIVHYPAPVVSDNCPGVTAVCSPASGSFFPVGTTMVTCTATDATGNTATCSFTVTVTNEAPPPLIPCPANIINCRLYPNICCQ